MNRFFERYLIKTVITLVSTAILAYAGWLGKTVVSLDQRTAKLEAHYQDIKDRLDDIFKEITHGRH